MVRRMSALHQSIQHGAVPEVHSVEDADAEQGWEPNVSLGEPWAGGEKRRIPAETDRRGHSSSQSFKFEVV